MSEIKKMLAANQEFAGSFTQGDLPMPPARHVAILTCMDARIHPAKALGLELGDAHVIRNAGGRASDDAIRSLIISSRLLGTTEFAVIHHTDCGMLTFTNDISRRSCSRRRARTLPASTSSRSRISSRASATTSRASCPRRSSIRRSRCRATSTTSTPARWDRSSRPWPPAQRPRIRTG